MDTSTPASALAAWLLLLAGLGGAAEGGQVFSTTATATAGGQDGAGSAGQAGEAAVSVVSCSGDSCTVTLGGDATVDVLGVTSSLRGIDAGRADLRVGDRDVSCTRGQTVVVGSVRLTCTTVTDDTVTLVMSRA